MNQKKNIKHVEMKLNKSRKAVNAPMKSKGKDKSTQTQLDLTSRQPEQLVLHGFKHIELSHQCHYPRLETVNVRARRKFIISSILCMILMITEIVGGILGGSLALILDATHLLVDVSFFMLTLFAVWLANRRPSQRLNFGLYRMEVLGTMYAVLFVWFIIGSLVYLATRRIMYGNLNVNAVIMITISAMAILVNLIIGFQLRFDVDMELLQVFGRKRLSLPARHQDHRTKLELQIDEEDGRNVGPVEVGSQSFKSNKSVQTKYPQYGAELNENIYNDNGKTVQSNSKLLINISKILCDVLPSLCTFLAGWLIYVKPEWSIIDPILVFLFAIVILATTFGVISETLLILMEGTPTFLDYDEVYNTFLSIKGVQSVHNLHIWALTINKIACVAHLQVDEEIKPQAILIEATAIIHKRFNFYETTIQIDQ